MSLMQTYNLVEPSWDKSSSLESFLSQLVGHPTHKLYPFVFHWVPHDRRNALRKNKPRIAKLREGLAPTAMVGANAVPPARSSRGHLKLLVGSQVGSDRIPHITTSPSCLSPLDSLPLNGSGFWEAHLTADGGPLNAHLGPIRRDGMYLIRFV